MTEDVKPIAEAPKPAPKPPAPKKLTARKPPAKKPAIRAADVPITPALIRRVLEAVTLVFLPANGRLDDAGTVNPGAAHTVTLGPFPEAARHFPEEWADFERIGVAVDGDRREYDVATRYTRKVIG